MNLLAFYCAEHPDDLRKKPDVCEVCLGSARGLVDMVQEFPDSLPYCPVCDALEDVQAQVAFKHQEAA